MIQDITSFTLVDALENLQKKDFRAIEMAESFLRHIEQLNPLLNAFITMTPELACQAALAADGILTLQPSNMGNVALLGLPVAIKDMIETAGVRTTAGSRFFSDHVPAEDAEIVLKLKFAGVVPLGKTNTHEIALGTTGMNPHFGAVMNPWDLSRISGGSSSGSAAAVAAGMCLAALGTDTGGSVRIPASLCGVVGLKPTYGRISARGVIPLSWNLDHVGPITKTVRDAALMLSVLAGFDSHDAASYNIPVDNYLSTIEDGVKGWKIALLQGAFFEPGDPEVLNLVNKAAQVFKSLGAEIESVDTDWMEDLAAANSHITQADAAAFHRKRLQEHPDWFGDDVRQRLEFGRTLTSTEYSLAMHSRLEGKRKIENLFTKYDILLLPTTPITAPTIEGTDGVEAARLLTRFTSPFNLVGAPAISLPCGFSDAGLPVGLQLVAKAWDETRLLQAGYAYENNTGWDKYHPPV